MESTPPKNSSKAAKYGAEINKQWKKENFYWITITKLNKVLTMYTA